jgi:large subunit ribosomal protein L7Ae
MVKKGKKGKKQEPAKPPQNPLFEATPRNYRIGGHVQPKKDLYRYVRWPAYVRLQRQRSILMSRLKVPPPVNQFSYTLDKPQQSALNRLLRKYSPESKAEKKERRTKAAQGSGDSAKPEVLKYGLNHITWLVENQKARLVVIAKDVDPIELVVWLPALCRKFEVPFCIVKSKASLGKLVHKKTAAAVAIESVKKEDVHDLENLRTTFRSSYNENKDMLTVWGGGSRGIKSTNKLEAREKAIAREQIKKSGAKL